MNIVKSAQTSIIIITIIILKNISVICPCLNCLLISLHNYRHLKIPFRYSRAVHTFISILFLILYVYICISVNLNIILKSAYVQSISNCDS